MTLQQNGFAAEQIDAPQTVLGVAKRSQPGWPTAAWVRAVVCCEYSANNVFIQLQTKCQIDLLGDSGTAETGVAPLYLNDGLDDFPRWTFGAWLAPTTW